MTWIPDEPDYEEWYDRLDDFFHPMSTDYGREVAFDVLREIYERGFLHGARCASEARRNLEERG